MARNGYVTINVDTTVDVELSEFVGDVVDQADEQTRTKLRNALGLDRAVTGAPLESVVERAYLVARQMRELPRELADLFWHVHGRAI